MSRASAWSTGSGSKTPLLADEVVDLDDQRVLDLGQELLLGDGGAKRVRVAGVQQPLQHDPAVGDVAVAGQVQPAHAAVRQGPHHLVLPGDQVAGGQLGGERIGLAARGAGVLQWGQNRRSSGTSARAITALDGSTAGAGGTWVSPCPTRPMRIRPEAGLRRGCGRVPNEEARADPRAVEPSWTEAFVIPDSTVSPGPAGGIPQVSQ